MRVEVKVARIELMGKLQIKWPPSGNGPRDPDSKLPPITKRHSLAQLLPVDHQDIPSPNDSNFNRVTGNFLYFEFHRSCIRIAIDYLFGNELQKWLFVVDIKLATFSVVKNSTKLFQIASVIFTLLAKV